MNIGGTPGQRSTSPTSTPWPLSRTCSASASTVTRRMPVSTPASERAGSSAESRFPERVQLNPTGTVAQWSIETHLHAKHIDEETQRAYLVSHANPSSVYADDLRSFRRLHGKQPPGSSLSRQSGWPEIDTRGHCQGPDQRPAGSGWRRLTIQHPGPGS